MFKTKRTVTNKFGEKFKIINGKRTFVGIEEEGVEYKVGKDGKIRWKHRYDSPVNYYEKTFKEVYGRNPNPFELGKFIERTRRY